MNLARRDAGLLDDQKETSQEPLAIIVMREIERLV
jgi:hypothetical protein